MWYGFFKFWIQVLFTLFFKMQVTGRTNIPRSGGVIVASNHQSYIDPLVVGAAATRPLYFMARSSLFHHNFLFAWLIRTVNAFPVERDRGDIGAVRQTLRFLASDKVVLGFPEATRTHTGEIGPLKRGLFVIAARAGAPVVPALIHGAYEAWPRTQLLPRPWRITVSFSEPLVPEAFGNDADAMAQACAAALARLQSEARAVSPGAAR